MNLSSIKETLVSFGQTRFIRFLGIGGVATAAQFILLFIFIELFSWPKVASSALAYALASVLNYLLNYYLTFGAQGKHRETFSKFIVVVALGLALNTLIFDICLRIGFHYILAQITATGITTISNYLLHKLWIYRKPAST